MARTEAYKGLEEVAGAVVANSGLLTVPMRVLREAVGAGALGEHIRKGIADGLIERGIDYFPKLEGDNYDELPPQYQNDFVRLYKTESPAEELIHAVLNPTPKNDNQLLQALAWIKILKQKI